MASQKVHGITIDLDVNTSGVSQSFSDINKSLSSTQRELTAVDRLLKNNANNVTLMAQKQSLLSDAIEKTSAKLEDLNRAKEKADSDDSIGKDSKAYRELVRDIERTKASLENLEKQQYENNNQWDRTKRGVEDVGDEMDNASGKALKFGDVLKANLLSDAIIDGIKNIANAVKEFAGTLNEWADGYREMEVYERQFESNLKNTANASDEQIASLKQLAKQKERTGVVSAKAITSAYQELATYVESADAVEGMTDALVDMAAQQYGVDATEESVRNLATTLGKALANGDYSGLTRLGYGFDETQQKIMKYGDELERVAVLNDVIESSIGGMNEALAQTDEGKLFAYAQAFDDAKESIGEVVSQLEIAFLEEIFPYVQEFLDGVVTWVDENKDTMMEMVGQIVEWLTSEETQNFFAECGQLVLDLVSMVGSLVELDKKLGIIKITLQLVHEVVKFISDLFDNIVADIEYINKHGIMGFAARNYNSYDWGAGGDSFTPGWSGGFGSLNSGGYNSGGITLNANFNVTSNDVRESEVRQWASWLVEEINTELGNAI